MEEQFRIDNTGLKQVHDVLKTDLFFLIFLSLTLLMLDPYFVCEMLVINTVPVVLK